MNIKTLVLGASLKPERISNQIIHRLLRNGHEVYAFGLRPGNINGVEVSDKRRHIPEIHTISLYISPKHQMDYLDYILELNPKRVIFNPGTENPEFFNILKSNGIYVEVACSLVLLATNQY